MRRLAGTAELLDGPLDDPVTLTANLRDLSRINQLLGGTNLTRRALQSLVAGRSGPLTFLDIGTGAADIPSALAAEPLRNGPRLVITAVDRRAEVIAAAIARSPGLARTSGLRLGLADGLALPDGDRSQDIVHASLLLHHLEPDEALRLLREMARVAALGVIVNDLARGRLAWLGAWLIGHLLTRNRFTRHDAPLSVRRAYTPAEMRGLMTQAGLRPVVTVRGVLGHRYAIAAVPGSRR